MNMNVLTWFALICYGLAFLGVLILAAAYLVRSEFMPYHSVAVARPWQDVDPAMQILLMALIRVVGATNFALGVSGILMLYLLFSQQWGFPQLLAFQLFCLIAVVPPLAVTLYVRKKTKAPTPVLSVCSIGLLTLAGFAFAVLSGQYL
jgi:hypothetical protein